MNPLWSAAARDRAAVLALRGLAYRLLEGGHYRQAALCYLQALRGARRLGLPEPRWDGLAFAYRMLWSQTGQERYRRRYLRYTRERADALQIQAARASLGRRASAFQLAAHVVLEHPPAPAVG